MALNEYDQILSQGSTGEIPSESDSYEAIIDQEKGLQKQQLQQSMYVATSKQPERAAKVMELSRRTNIPADIVDRQYDQISKKQALTQTDYDSLIANSPSLSKWLEDPNNASASHDDLDSLKNIESSLSDRSYGGELLDALKVGGLNISKGALQVPALVAKASELQLAPPGVAEDTASRMEIEEANKGFKVPEVLYKNAATEKLDALAKRYQPQDMDADITREALAGNFKKAGRAFSFQVASNLPQLVLVAAGGPFGLAAIGTLAASQKMAENLEKGIDPDTARFNAVMSGAIETGTEMIGGITGRKVIKESVEQLTRTVGKQTSLRVIKDGLRNLWGSTVKVLGTAGEEGLEEIIATNANAVLDWATDVDPKAFDDIFIKSLNSFFVGAGAGGVVGGVIQTKNSMQKYSDQVKAQTSTDTYTAVGEESLKSKLWGRSKDLHAEYVQSVVKDTSAEFIYVNPETLERYFQNTDDDVLDVMNKVGAIEAYNEAKETGSDVKISYPEWIKQTLDTPHYTALSQDIKFEQGALSVNEVKEDEKQAKEELEAVEAEAAVEGKPTTEEERIKRSGRAVQQDVAAQLRAINEDPRQAVLYRGFEVLGQRTGKDPLELYNRYNLRISRGDSPAKAILAAQSDDEITLDKGSQIGETGVIYGQTEQQRREAGAAGRPGVLGQQVQAIAGLPKTSPGPSQRVREIARAYAEKTGIQQRQQAEYVQVDPERGKRIADAYEAMEHAPEDPAVKKAYRALIDETLAQYQSVKEMGLKIERITPDMENPYKDSNAMIEDVNNGHLWFYPTDLGFGTESTETQHPLLEQTGEEIDGVPLVANDVFRIVHDIFGHAKEGVGFGPRGEENAWQAHARMYSPEAVKALTTETRGQNSWVNFGPKGEANRADPANTTYADQKAGLLPDFASTEGVSEDVDERVLQQAVPYEKPADIKLDYEPHRSLLPEQRVAEEDLARTLDKPEAEADYSKLPGVYKGKLLDTDAARFLSRFFNQGRLGAMLYTQSTHQPAGQWIWNLFLERLKKPATGFVMLMGGGGGSGKSTVLEGPMEQAVSDAEIVFDGTGQRLDDQIEKIERSLESGRTVRNVFVYVEAIEAARRAVGRFKKTGRTIPPYQFVKGHVVALNNFIKLAEKYKGNPDVTFVAFDNTGSKPVEITIEKLSELRYNKGEAEEEAINKLLPEAKEILDVAEKEIAEAIKKHFPRDKGQDEQVAQGIQRAGAQEPTGGGRQGGGGRSLQQEGQVAPSFFSKLIQTVEEKMGASATVEQVNGMLRDIKPEERKWLGLDEILKGKEKISKEELLSNLRGNMVEIREVSLGGATAEEVQGEYYIEEGPEGSPFPFLVVDWASNPIESFKTEEEAQDFIENRAVVERATKFSQYTLPGGENYREVLFAMPPAPVDTGLKIVASQDAEGEFDVVDANGRVRFTGSTTEDAQTYIDEEAQLTPTDDFRSPHFDEPNVLAHTRLNDRTDSEGNKVLFVEEIQSDWHQAGRKRGYKGDLTKEEKELQSLNAKTYEGKKLTKKERARLDELAAIPGIADSIVAKSQGVPDAPFRKTWHEFVLKRLIREAAEKGYDKVAWTTGEQQAERYDLSKQISRVEINDLKKANGDGYTLNAIDHNGDAVISKRLSSLSEVENYVGKEVAAKLEEREFTENEYGIDTKTIEGIDLKVGGEGMKGFYDKILPAFANKFGKKYGARVSDSTIQSLKTSGGYYADVNTEGKHAVFFSDTSGAIPQEISVHKTKAQASEEASLLNAALDVESKIKVHSLEITPELKEAALSEGFSLFQGGEQGPRGQITIGPDRQLNIELLKSANKSTFIHETGHLYVEVLTDLVAEMQNIPEDQRTDQQSLVIEDFKTLIEWAGGTFGERVSTEAHEKIARGFETYLFEGKAPTSALRKAFARFRVWLVNIYRTIGNLKAELTPEVRDVMDRMLATDEEIEAAYSELNQVPLFSDPKFQGMSIEKTKAYLRAVEEAREYTESEINQKMMRHHERVRSQEYQAERDRLLPEITEEVNAMPIYQTLNKFATEKLPDGKPFRLSYASVAEFGADVVKQLPKGVVAAKNSGSGMELSDAAEALGYDSPQDLVTQLINSVPKEQKINELADLEMERRFPDLMKSGELPEEVMKVVHNRSRAKMLRMELEHLVSNNLPVVKEAIRRVARRVPTEKAVRAQAIKIIGTKAVGDIKPYIYQRAEAKAAKEAGILLAKGDIDGAFEAKRKELLNHELYLAAVEAVEQTEKALDKFKRVMRKDELLAKTRDIDMVNAARAILAQFGIGKPDTTPESYLKSMKEYDPETYEGIINLIEAATEKVGPYKTVAFDDFIAMRDAVDAIWDLSKSAKEIEIDGIKVSLDEAREEVQAEIADISGEGKQVGYNEAASKWEKVKITLLGARAALTRTEAWVEAIGLKSRKVIWNPISEATTKYRLKKTEVINKYKDLVVAWGKTIKPGKINAPELQYTFKDKTELMMALLHSGNESNLSKLLRGGRGAGNVWGEFDQDGNLDRSRWDAFTARLRNEGVLTKADYDFAQSIWDLNESLKPDAQKAHKQMHGHYFSEITANEIQTEFGTYRGGYIPAKVDTLLNEDAAIRREKDDFNKNNNSFQFPTTGRGFTKSRVNQYAAPLALDMTLLGSHIDDVLRFSHIEPAVKAVARIVHNKEFRATLRVLDPTVAQEMLIPWLQRAAQQRVVLPSTDGLGKAIDGVASFLRRSVAMQIMVGNVKNALEQFTGLVVAATKVKPKYLRNAIMTYVGSAKSTIDNVIEKSDYMKTIYDTSIFQSYESINQILVNPSTFQNVADFAQRHTYFLQAATQNIVNTITWTAAYEQAVEGGLNEKEAIRAADAAVRLSQGSILPEDISRFETGTATKRLFTQFAGYFNMLLNLNQTEIQKISREIGLKKGAGKLFYVYLTAFMIPAVMAQFMGEALRGRLFDDDDDDGYLDDWLMKFFGAQGGTATAMIPFVGQVINSAANRFNKNMYDDRISLSPVISTLETVGGVPAELYDAINGKMKSKKRVTKDVLMFMGIASGLPIGPIARPAGYLIDVSEGKQRPTGPIDLTRGLITGTGPRK